MSPLIIILLMLILIIHLAHQIALQKYTIGDGIQNSSGNYDPNSSFRDQVNYVTINVDRNEGDPSIIRRTRLRQDFQHILSTMVKKIIQQERTKESKRLNPRMKNKNFEKTVESNKIRIGDYPEDNDLEIGMEARESIIDRSNDSGISEKLSKDLFQVSEALLPTIRRVAHSKWRKVRDYLKEPVKRGINQGNSSKGEQNSRMKREITKDEAIETAAWMKKDFNDHQANLKMHAFVVKDEEIPPCCSPAKQITNRRYFMCSGAILTLKHAITSASCVHYADIYESNVEAELAVLIGATEPRSYVIKINRYEMHPDYEYDVDSRNYATNNLAILYLACSIVAQDVVVPSLPKGLNDDVAHMCCRESCHLITIMENNDNRHTAHIVQAKHLPAPRHDDLDLPSYRELSNSALETLQVINKPIFTNESFTPARRIRSPLKLAPAPIFFGKESRRSSRLQNSVKSVEPSNTKKRKKIKLAQNSSVKYQQRDGKRKRLLNFDGLINKGRTGRAYIPIMRALEKQGVNVEEELASIDWQKVEETMSKKIPSNKREKMDIFAKNIVDETMKRLESVLGDEEEGDDIVKMGNGSSVFEKLMPSTSRNKSIESFVHVFTKVVSSLVPPNNAASFAITLDTSLEEKDLKDPPPSNQECPPLGSPVFADGILVGLLAYTCDDVQSWVEWKYVNIAKNINWIRKQMTTEHGTVVICAGPEKPVQPLLRLADDTQALSTEKRLEKESETEIRDRKVESKRRETTGIAQRNRTTENFEHARNPMTGRHLWIPKDRWFARNSPLSPQVQRANEQPRIIADSRNQPQSLPRVSPVYNVNTCYVKSDGSADCQTRDDFDIS